MSDTPRSGPREIDIHFQGVARSVCCHAVDGVLVDPGPASTAERLVGALDGARPHAILLTHIHLDHAGATGVLVRRWPDVEVWVHERGARHLADPSKLIASAARIYGDEMERLWGEIAPVPADRIRALDGDGGELDGWSWAYTPGHASHHVSYLRDGIAYVGDVGGVRIGDGPALPPTPPPDIDLRLWRRSLDVVESWDAEALALAHFGLHTNVTAQLAEVRACLTLWEALARDLDADAFEAQVRDQLRGLPEERAYLAAMPPEPLHSGLRRAMEQTSARS